MKEQERERMINWATAVFRQTRASTWPYRSKETPRLAEDGRGRWRRAVYRPDDDSRNKGHLRAGLCRFKTSTFHEVTGPEHGYYVLPQTPAELR